MPEPITDGYDEEKEAIEIDAAAKKLEAEEKEKGDEKGDEEEKEEEEKYDEKEEPPTRKSVQDHIIERKNKKIAKLEKKEEEKEEDEGNFTSEDKDAIGKEIDKKTEPLKEVLKAQSDKNELDALKNKYSSLSKAMEKRIIKYANHKSYQNVPYENIYLMLAGQKSVSQAKKEEAKKGDKKNETGGHTFRKGDKKLPDFRKMSDEEFDEYDKAQINSQL